MPDNRFTMSGALDRYITGNYGEDQFDNVRCEHCGGDIDEEDVKCQACGWPTPKDAEDDDA